MSEAVFDKPFARRVVALLLRSPSHAFRIAEILRPQWIEDDSLADFVEVAIPYIRKHKTLPTAFILDRELGEKVSKSPVYRTLMNIDIVSEAAYVMEHFVEFCRERALVEATVETADKIRDGRRTGIIERFQTALSVGTDMTNLGSRFSDVKTRLKRYRMGSTPVGLVPTGWEHLDQLMHGGLGPGELGVIMAPSKKGKSHGLTSIGYHNTVGAQPRNVAHASFETSKDELLARYDRRIAGRFAGLMQRSPRKFADHLAKHHRLLRAGDVMVNYWPTRSLSVAGLRNWLDMLSTAQGFAPDLLLVDYGDIMKPERRLGEPRHEQAGIFEDLRALAGEFKLPIWTATQTNRAAVSKKIVRMEDVGESFEKVQIADAVVTFCGTPSEIAEGRMRLFLAAMRRSVSEVTISASFDFSRSLIRTDGIVGHVKVTGKRKDKEDPTEAAMERVARVGKKGKKNEHRDEIES